MKTYYKYNRVKIFSVVLLLVIQVKVTGQLPGPDAGLNKFFENYTAEYYRLFPVSATYAGENLYNDKLPITFTDSYNAILREFYQKKLQQLKEFNPGKLSDPDKLSYSIFQYNLETSLQGLSFKSNRMPFSQIDAFTNQFAQLGSGNGAQPFKTIDDYQKWLLRASLFPVWADSAIAYFEKGISEGIVLPKALVIKMIPQLQGLQSAKPGESIFYGPVKNFPSDFSSGDRTRLTKEYNELIRDIINPTYYKLEKFLENKYLPLARNSSGLAAFANGKDWYNHQINNYTTTRSSPEELYQTGLSEVDRIQQEMEKVKREMKFEGSLDSFFVFVKTDKQFLPYQKPEEVLDAYREILKKIEPHLDKYFSLRPKTGFEVRQTESFRAASASAEYRAGLPDGSRLGIFYVPILDARKYTRAKENLFIHEAIPGHHFQIMIQRENRSLPTFRQQGGYSAYSEGWALYCESLGKLLGCYTEPYFYFTALGDEIHRAIRLVVDVGIHSKGWSREKAIDYMRKNEPITEQAATAEIERYMARPGQALSYKVGQMKISSLRQKYEDQLGKKFSLAAFHNELLKDGSMPLILLEQKLDAWARSLD